MGPHEETKSSGSADPRQFSTLSIASCEWQWNWHKHKLTEHVVYWGFPCCDQFTHVIHDTGKKFDTTVETTFCYYKIFAVNCKVVL